MTNMPLIFKLKTKSIFFSRISSLLLPRGRRPVRPGGGQAVHARGGGGLLQVLRPVAPVVLTVLHLHVHPRSLASRNFVLRSLTLLPSLCSPWRANSNRRGYPPGLAPRAQELALVAVASVAAVAAAGAAAAVVVWEDRRRRTRLPRSILLRPTRRFLRWLWG